VIDNCQNLKREADALYASGRCALPLSVCHGPGWALYTSLLQDARSPVLSWRADSARGSYSDAVQRYGEAMQLLEGVGTDDEVTTWLRARWRVSALHCLCLRARGEYLRI